MTRNISVWVFIFPSIVASTSCVEKEKPDVASSTESSNRTKPPPATSNQSISKTRMGKIVVKGIPKPKNMRNVTIAFLKQKLGFDEMEDPKSEWNSLRDAARRIFTKKGFTNDRGQRYQGWAKADERKKSSARAKVYPSFR